MVRAEIATARRDPMLRWPLSRFVWQRQERVLTLSGATDRDRIVLVMVNHANQAWICHRCRLPRISTCTQHLHSEPKDERPKIRVNPSGVPTALQWPP